MGSLFKQERKVRDVEVGSVYRRTGPGDLVETARVLSVSPDAAGIPHVRYEVSIKRPAFAEMEDRRTLNLESFAERFAERIEA